MIRIVIAALAVTSVSLANADDCGGKSVLVDIAKTTASASSWSNVRNSEGSLRFEANRLVTEAQKLAESAKAPENLCPEGCVAVAKPDIEFRSTPNKFLSDYSERAKCEAHRVNTSAKPIEYPSRLFPTMDAFSEWFSQFSQGSGTEGKDLYAKCDGSCSPQYRCEISSTDTGLSVDAFVLCGHARDKGDNQYVLETKFRWSCKAP